MYSLCVGFFDYSKRYSAVSSRAAAYVDADEKVAELQLTLEGSRISYSLMLLELLVSHVGFMHRSEKCRGSRDLVPCPMCIATTNGFRDMVKSNETRNRRQSRKFEGVINMTSFAEKSPPESHASPTICKASLEWNSLSQPQS